MRATQKRGISSIRVSFLPGGRTNPALPLGEAGFFFLGKAEVCQEVNGRSDKLLMEPNHVQPALLQEFLVGS